VITLGRAEIALGKNCAMTHAHIKYLTLSLMGASAIALTACGGGGGSSATASPISAAPPPPQPTTTTPTPPPTTASAPSFSPGVFEPADNFEAMCETPRIGVDSEGTAFPDQAGSETLEKFWLRSWTNETYLWNFEVPDENPDGFDNRLEYFEFLRSPVITPSGEDQDDFHFSEPTTEFLDRRNSAPRSGYGARFTFIRSTPPREVRVLYTEPNSPASAVQNGVVNFPRGTSILEIDGVDLVNGNNTDALNDGLFPATAGETHNFVVLDPGATQPRNVTITSADVTPAPVNRTRIIDTASGRVGYMLFNTFSPFSSEQALANAFADLSAQNIDDLVLDLRYNGGGLLAVSAQLGYMIAGQAQTQGLTYSLQEYNPDASNRNPVTGRIIEPFPFINEGVGFSVAEGTPLASVNLPRVFILSTEGTCSASEALINGLRGIDVEVILIGDTTCGKPYGFFPTDNCGRTYYTIQFRSLNEKGFGDYADGFAPQDSGNQFAEITPGCTVQDDLSEELGNENETLLATALSYRETGQCPVPLSNAKPSASPYTTSRSTAIAGATTTEGAINTFGDPFVTTAGSYLDATLPEK